MELDQLTDWLWCLCTDFVHAYAVREGDGFCLIDTSTAGHDEAILELLGGLAGSAAEEVEIVEIFLTHGHSDHTGSAAAMVARTGARVVAAVGDAPLIRAEQCAPPPQLTASTTTRSPPPMLARRSKTLRLIAVPFVD